MVIMDYSSTVRELDEVTREVSVSIEANKLSDALEKNLVKLQRTVQVKGFRAGKAPLALVKKLHSDSERNKVFNSLIQESLQSVLRENNIETYGTPNIEIKSYGDGDNSIEYSAQVFLPPLVTIELETPFEIEVPPLLDVDKLIDAHVNSIRRKSAEFKPVEGRQEVLTNDAVGVIAEKSGDDSQQENEDCKDPDCTSPSHNHHAEKEKTEEKYILGREEIIPEVESALIGKKLNELFEVKYKKPDGTEASVSLRVVNIYEATVPELSEELLEKEVNEKISVADFLEKLRTDKERIVEIVRDRIVRDKLFTKVSERGKVILPEVMIYQWLGTYYGKSEDFYWVNVKTYLQTLPEENRNDLINQATAGLRRLCLLKECCLQLGIHYSEAMYMEFFSEFVDSVRLGLESPDSTFVRSLLEKDDSIKSEILAFKCMRELRDRANIKEVEEQKSEE
jgi:trigger factor